MNQSDGVLIHQQAAPRLHLLTTRARPSDGWSRVIKQGRGICMHAGARTCERTILEPDDGGSYSSDSALDLFTVASLTLCAGACVGCSLSRLFTRCYSALSHAFSLCLKVTVCALHDAKRGDANRIIPYANGHSNMRKASGCHSR